MRGRDARPRARRRTAKASHDAEEGVVSLTCVTNEPYRSPLNLSKSVALLLLQVIVSMGAVGSMVLASFSVSTCQARCGFAPVGAFYRATVWTTLVALPFSIVVVAVRARGGRTSWWAPAVASALVAAVALVGIEVTAVALSRA